MQIRRALETEADELSSLAIGRSNIVFKSVAPKNGAPRNFHS